MRILHQLAAIGLGLIVARPGLAAQPARPVVVELFTSQGCSSCPPADVFLTSLAQSRPDVLALAFHVTYWNNLGWSDPFSLDAATSRQRAYQALLHGESVYTPQMVIDGEKDVIGSDRTAALTAIEAARATGAAIAISAIRNGNGIAVRVAAGAGEANLLLVGYDSQHQTQVGRGENSGQHLVESNIVRAIDPIGAWHGGALSLTVARPIGDHAALILQTASGRILGAALVPD